MPRLCLDCECDISQRQGNALRCVECAEARRSKLVAERVKEWRILNYEKAEDAARRYNAASKVANRESHMLYQARRRAKTRGLPCTISEADIVIPAQCPVLGITIAFGGHRDCTPALDMIDPSRGYVPGNVQVISQRANRCKSDLTIPEMRLLALAFLKWSA